MARPLFSAAIATFLLAPAFSFAGEGADEPWQQLQMNALGGLTTADGGVWGRFLGSDAGFAGGLGLRGMGSLDKELIRQVIKKNVTQVRFCYEQQLIELPTLSGKVAVKFVIAPDGSVSSAQAVENTSGNLAFQNCIAARVRTWRFPKPKGNGSVIVTYPFVFKVAEGDGGTPVAPDAGDPRPETKSLPPKLQ